MNKGLVYVFLKKDGAPLPIGCMGHVGWGFAIENGPGDMDAIAGSTENYKGEPIIKEGDDNGSWLARFRTDIDMFREMTKRNYDGYKVATVRNWNSGLAVGIAQAIAGAGYGIIGNNCLDHTYQVLEAYGVKDLPSMQWHASPTDWFAQFNGEYHNL